MALMVTRKDYDALAAAGGLAKPTGKRKPDEGHQTYGSTLRTYARLSPVGANQERREAVDGEQSEACRMLACVICGAPPPSEPHHDPKRTQGGLDKDTGPLCYAHHAESETMALSKFRRKYGLNWGDVCDAVRDWMHAGYPQGQMPFGGRK